MFAEAFYALCKREAERESVIQHIFSQTKKYISCLLEYRIIRIEVVFQRMVLGQVPNILFCKIYPAKSSDTYYFLPEVFCELDIPEYRACFFSTIESEERLEACFSALFELLHQYIPVMEEAATLGRLPTKFDVTESDTLERKMMANQPFWSRDTLVLFTYTRKKPYRDLLCGNTDRALNWYRKRDRKNLFEYERRLAEYIGANPAETIELMPPQCNAVAVQNREQKNEFFAFLKGGFLCYAFFSLLFCGGMFLFSFFYNQGCEAALGAPWYFGFVSAAIPAIFGILGLRRLLTRIVAPKSSDWLLRLDGIQNGKGINLLGYWSFGIFTAFSVVITALVLLSTVRVYSDYLEVPQQNPFDKEIYEFSEIDTIYHISARYNEYEDRISFGSYVIVMNDGRQFDFYGSAGERETENKVLPLLEQYDIEVVRVDSDRDLPPAAE